MQHHLFHSVHQLSRELTRQVNEELQPLGIYSAQWSVLYVLHNVGPLTQSALCRHLAVEAPPMTRVVQRLVKQGYVQQVAGEDKRAKYVELTEAAVAAFPVWESAISRVHEKTLRQIPELLQQELSDSLQFWLRQLKGEIL
ncbi:MarR family winged helix-turn-helix transcriptional regulator [Ectobacillus ponti]|uniref:MarR family transcriptional regulator n=1 Tax=Ectobacillus ponti TaxID=2961894 RepID=A0AA41X9C8_9BACI|nr:MarR family transcriptional regulator [Ectobacillus ponti]MCP8969275.1 MarR family transcriptional regulator [Ectobacillus ponti]